MKMKKLLSVCLAVIMMLCVFPLSSGTNDGSAAVIASAAFGQPSMKSARLTVMPGQKVSQSLLDKNGKKISNDKITWSSSNKAVAKVSAKGNITGVKSGTAVISAKYSGRTYYCVVTCKNAKLKYSSKTITVGEKFLQKLSDPSGKAISGTDITWKSENKKTAYVSSKGTVTGKKAGTVKITATYLGKAYSFTVTVKNPELPLPTTLDEIINLNNTALANTQKQKNFTITTKEPENINLAIAVGTSGETLNIGSDSKTITTKKVFTNGKTKNGETVSEIYDQKPLKASYVASATAKKSGSNTVITIYLKPETASWTKDKVTHAKGNEALFNAELEGFDPLPTEKVSFTYTGTVLQKTINNDGLVVKEKFVAPVEGKMAIKFSETEKATTHAVSFEIKAEKTFTYR